MEFENTVARKIGLVWYRLTRNLGCQLQENKAGITPDQFRLLTQLWKMDGCNQFQLSRSLGRDRSAITRMIAVLEKKKLIMRISDENDARVNRIFLTREGKSLKSVAEKSAQETLNQALLGFSESETNQLTRMLERIAKNLK